MLHTTHMHTTYIINLSSHTNKLVSYTSCILLADPLNLLFVHIVYDIQ